MEFQHVNVKIFVDGELKIDLERFIEVFHQWVAEQSMDELLIDVADYRHVPAGPGVVLVGHEADYAIDNGGNRFGLLYNRKATLDGTNEDRFRQALQSAALACQRLESQFEAEGQLRFSRQQFEVLINDRALAANTPATLENFMPEFKSFLASLLGHDEFIVDHNADARSRFSVAIDTVRPWDFAALLATK